MDHKREAKIIPRKDYKTIFKLLTRIHYNNKNYEIPILMRISNK